MRCDHKVKAEVEMGVIASEHRERGNPPIITLPAFIDLHVHLREPGFEHKEDIESGSKAAIAGGFGTIFCMPNTRPVADNVETIRYILKRAKEVGLVTVYPVAAITRGSLGKELTDFKALKAEGVIALTDDGRGLQDERLMLMACEKARELDLLLISHAEDENTSDTRTAENKMSERDIRIAMETGARLHLAHVSTKEVVEMVRHAKEKGAHITCEATPHHLLLTSNSSPMGGGRNIPSPLRGEGQGGGGLHPNFIMNPPLREEADCQALIKGLQDGTIDAIATDHAPHTDEEKKLKAVIPAKAGIQSRRELDSRLRGNDIVKIPPGVIGMETAFPVCMKLVDAGHISFERLIELLTTGPAKVAKIKLGKKQVRIDLDKKYKIDADKFFSKSRNCPFNGWQVRGKIIDVV